MRGKRRDHGFTLIEVVISVLVLATMAAGTSVLFSSAVASIRTARVQTWTSLLALDKLEELRGRTFDGMGLTPAPVDSLARDTAGYVDYLDQFGRAVAGERMSPGAVYVRRWNIQWLPADPVNTVILQVLVTPAARVPPTSGGLVRVPGDALIATVRTRITE